MTPPFAELAARTHFSFLEGASSPNEMVAQAVALGLSALAVADRDGLYGIVRAHVAASEAGLPLVIGATLTLEDAPPLVLLVQDRRGYGRLCRLVTHMRSQRGDRLGAGLPPEGHAASPRSPAEVDDAEDAPDAFPGGKVVRPLALDELLRDTAGLLALQRPGAREDPALIARLKEGFGDRLYLAIARYHEAGEEARLARALALSHALAVPLVAVAAPRYHDPARRPLADVVTCIRHRTKLTRAGRLLLANAERGLRGPEAMARLFSDLPDAVSRTDEVAARCDFSLDELDFRYATEVVPPGRTPMEHLRHLVGLGARRRYRGRTPDDVRRQLEHELKLIDELGFPGYFLTVWDIVRFARSRGILCQGRGSAANSAVCYVLGITAIDPVRMGLLFERFLSVQRGEPPDIDVDFEHERREEVIQYLYRKYGREHAGMVAEVICYRGRSALRETGKAFGLSVEQLDRLSRAFGFSWHLPSDPAEVQAVLEEAGLDARSPVIRQVVSLASQLEGTPRHLSVHVGGFVITQDPLVDLVPQEDAAMPGRTVIAWDKYDVDATGMLKVDVLGLGILTALRKAFDLLARHQGIELTLASLPPEDPDVYEQISRADTVGVFQIESRAQMNMLPRLQPRTFYDLVVEVAIVRPGPIQGDMVHPYLRRRRGEEVVDFPHPGLKEALGRTYGVPLFQEQAMRMSMVAAGFTATEADALRRAMGAWRRRSGMAPILDKLRDGLLENGVDAVYVDRVLRQIAGFGEYGFPESHAASFALLAYASAWLKYHHPEAFACALLNSQPMGFYASHSLVDDAKRHGVPVFGVDVNASGWDCDLESVPRARPRPRPPGAGRASGLWALRLGFRLVTGLREAEGREIEEARLRGGPFSSVGEVARRGRAARDTLARLAAADAFSCLGLSRRQALWQVQGLYDERTPMFAGQDPRPSAVRFPAMGPGERVRADYAATGLSCELHPTVLVREALDRLQVRRARDLPDLPERRRVRVGGLITSRQHPDTRTGMIFLALEDETGMVNVAVPRRVYEHHRALIHRAVFVWAEGSLERDGRALNVLARRLGEPRSEPVSVRSRDFR